MVRTTRMQFFAIALLLQSLTDPKVMERVAKLRSSYSRGPKAAGFLLGFKLIIEAVLYRQIELMVTFPEILHLQSDDDLCRWWLNGDERSALRFLDIAQDDAPNSTPVAKSINELLLRVHRTGVDWKKFAEVSVEVSSFARMVLSMAEYCRVTLVRRDGSDLLIGFDQASRQCAAEFLYDLAYEDDYRMLSNAFDYTSNESLKWEEGSFFEDLEMDGIQTSKDVVSIRPLRLKGLHRFAVLGINTALATAIGELTNRKPDIIGEENSLPPATDLFGDLYEEFQAGRWPSLEYGLEFRDAPPQKTLEDIMSGETSTPDPREHLKALLGKDAFLVNSKGTRAAFHLQVLMEGLAKVEPTGRPIELLQIEHSGEPGQRHPPVSVAVRVGQDWHVFYYIDAVGRMTSWVWPFLDGFGDRVRITKIEGVSTDFLLSLCDRPFQYVSRQWKSQKDLNSHLRGVIPELLASLLLTRLGFFPIRTSLKLEGVGELDGLGYRKSADGGECKVVEVKKESTSQAQLRVEIEEFTRKVRLIRQDPDIVEGVLGRPGPVETVSGMFISMAEVGEFTDVGQDEPERSGDFFDTTRTRTEFKSFLDSLENVDFWDCNRFNEELEKADLPPLPVRLLERARFIWDLTGADVDDQFAEWNSLQKAVENDNWMWPDSSDPLIATLDDILRRE